MNNNNKKEALRSINEILKDKKINYSFFKIMVLETKKNFFKIVLYRNSGDFFKEEELLQVSILENERGYLLNGFYGKTLEDLFINIHCEQNDNPFYSWYGFLDDFKSEIEKIENNLLLRVINGAIKEITETSKRNLKKEFIEKIEVFHREVGENLSFHIGENPTEDNIYIYNTMDDVFFIELDERTEAIKDIEQLKNKEIKNAHKIIINSLLEKGKTLYYFDNFIHTSREELYISYTSQKNIWLGKTKDFLKKIEEHSENEIFTEYVYIILMEVMTILIEKKRREEAQI